MIRLYAFIICCLITFASQAQVVEGEMIVQLEENFEVNDAVWRQSNIDLKKTHPICSALNIHLVSYDPVRSYDDISAEITGKFPVLNMMPNMLSEQRSIPNDKHYDKQENLRKIDIERAWSVSTGGETALGDRIVVAVLDSGYGLDIEDISKNHYINEQESVGDANGDGCPGDCGVDDDMDGKIDEDTNGRLPSHPLYDNRAAGDDDENGYVDDIKGLNMQTLTDQHPASNHGTAVAGIVGASGNDEMGVTGVNWDVDMLLISEVVKVSQIVEAYNYVYEQRRLFNISDGGKGANVLVTNFSSGIDNQFGEDFPIWCNLYDLLGSVGILSVGATTNSSRNVDEEGDLPTTCSSPYLISVTNLTLDDRLGSGGYGSTHIDLGAPGQGSFTVNLTKPGNVGEFSGTSAATPHVAGALALLYSIPCEAFATYYKENPSKVDELKEYLLDATDGVSDLEGKTVSEGRLNVYSTMVALKDFCPSADGGDLEITGVSPNPSFREEVRVEYISPDGEVDYDFLVFNMLGQLMHAERFNPQLYGERVLSFSSPELSAGVYYFVIRGKDTMVSHKQVITPY